MPFSHFDLAEAASEEMIREGFHPGFPPGSEEQVAAIRAQALLPPANGVRDLRQLPWSSIDNDTSRDLDQIEVAQTVAGGVQVMVGVADVSRSVGKDTVIDRHAAGQTQTVYTAVRNFPMLPNDLSTDLTSLNQDEDRAAIVIEFVVDASGALSRAEIYRALVRNHAQLAYSKVGPWLDGAAPPDAKVAASPALADQLQLQWKTAQTLHRKRVLQGALEFHRVEADPVVVDGQVLSIRSAHRNPATDLIEEFMIGANESMARTLKEAKRSSLRRIVKSPERWERIVDLVHQHGTRLPDSPDSAALNAFLQQQRSGDPIHYPDLSLAIIKLMGPGEYVLARGGDDDPPGHFALAAIDYTHSTAPNRRFADLVVQRLMKALLDGEAPPYTDDALAAIAKHLTERESAARKVERAMQKRVAAVALAGSIGKTYPGVVTGVNAKGVFVRIFEPPAEGKLVRGEHGLDVGDRIEATLVHTDPRHAFIDFERRER